MPELTSKEHVARWLAGKPRDVAAVFASRAALRVIPALAPALVPHGGQLKGTELRAVLGAFRCATAAWAVAAYPGHRDNLAPAADSASAAIVSPTASDVERSGEYAAAAAANAATFTEFAVASVNYAVEAGAIIGRQPFESLLQAYGADAQMLDHQVSPSVLATSQLWPGQMPDWAFEAWAELERALLDADEDWEVWTDWYEARLKGGPADQVLEVARATIPNDMWEQGPKAVNAEIRRMFEEREIWRYGMADKATGLSEVPAADIAIDLESRLAALSFEEASVIGARVALRAVPLLAPGPAEFGVDFLSTLRSVSLGWAAAEYPTRAAIRARSVPAYADASKSRAAIVRAIARATIAPAANSMTESVTHVLAVGIAALRSAAISSDGVAAGSVFDVVLGQDLNDLGGVPSTTAVAELPLWPGGSPPEWMAQRWDTLKRDLIKVGAGWEYWVDWYENRLSGRVRSEGRELAYAEVPVELWAEGPVRVNTWIIQRIKELEAQAIASQEMPSPDSVPVDPVHLQARATPQSMPSVLAVKNILTEHILTENETSSIAPPAIPAQRAAALEPVWSGGRLTLPKRPTKSDLTGRKFTAALKSLHEELCAFADDISDEANIDRRFVAHIRQLVGQIPRKMPRQTELFRLGHASVVFASYAKIVDDQWPEFLAAQYHAVVLHFDRTMLQSPLWREFIRNADQQALTAEQITSGFSLGTEVADALRSDEAINFIDPAIPNALDQLAGPLLSQIPVGNEPRDNVIEAGSELLAYDVVESVNNILKRIAEEALNAKALTGIAARGVGSILGGAGKDYTEGVGKGFRRAAKKQGPKDGEKLFKWLRRFILTGGTLAGSAVALPHLIAMYPQAFAWLKDLLRFLH